jgi:hypothetical protein
MFSSRRRFWHRLCKIVLHKPRRKIRRRKQKFEKQTGGSTDEKLFIKKIAGVFSETDAEIKRAAIRQ